MVAVFVSFLKYTLYQNVYSANFLNGTRILDPCANNPTLIFPEQIVLGIISPWRNKAKSVQNNVSLSRTLLKLIFASVSLCPNSRKVLEIHYKAIWLTVHDHACSKNKCMKCNSAIWSIFSLQRKKQSEITYICTYTYTGIMYNRYKLLVCCVETYLGCRSVEDADTNIHQSWSHASIYWCHGHFFLPQVILRASLSLPSLWIALPCFPVQSSPLTILNHIWHTHINKELDMSGLRRDPLYICTSTDTVTNYRITNTSLIIDIHHSFVLIPPDFILLIIDIYTYMVQFIYIKTQWSLPSRVCR
jgi:hypothetical protein